MTSRILLSALSSAALSLVASTIEAQQHSTVSISRIATTPRVVATYDFGHRRIESSLPIKVTVADSAGVLVASALLRGEQLHRPLTVTVMESSLVLQGETPDGVLTLVLDGQAASSGERLASGTWALGRAEGRLRARD